MKKRILSAILVLCLVLSVTVSLRADGVSVTASVSGGSISISLSGYSGSSAQVAVWSETNGQDDLIWYTMTKGTDGAYHATASTSQLKHTGVIWAHAYSGSTFLGSTSFSLSSGSSSSTPSLKTQANGSNYDIILSGYSGSSAKVAVWSENNGQDDLVWYTMTKNSDGTFSATAKTSVFKHTGVIWAHAYSGSTCLCELSFTWSGSSSSGSSSSGSSSSGSSSSTPSLKAQANGSNYDIILSGYSGSSAKVAVWSENNGQDDLVWYTMTKNSDGTFSATAKTSVFKHTGVIWAHAYSGSTCLCELSFTWSGSSSSGSSSSGGSSSGSSSSTPSLKAQANGSNYDIILSGYSGSSAKVAVWSETDGQDDLVWYTMTKNSDGTYRTSIKTSVLKHTGNICAHAYNGSTFILGITFELNSSGTSGDAENESGTGNGQAEETEATVTIGTVSGETIYPAVISGVNVEGGVKSVKLAVWSEDDGQDDLWWYDTVQSGDSWTVDIDISKHRSSGKFYAHAYAVSASTGKDVFLGEAVFTVGESNVSGTVGYDNLNSDEGTFRATASVSSSGLSVTGVKFRVWNTSDDERWYTAVADGSTYVAIVDIANHQLHTGTYNVEGWAVLSSGETMKIGTTKVAVNPTAYVGAATIDGSASRRLLVKDSGLSDVQFAVWTQEGDQDDLVWYEGISDGEGGFYADVLSSNHKHDGTYIVHIYTNSYKTFVTDLTFTMIDYLEWAVATAEDDSVGYSQLYRDLNPDVDCSSFVYYALKNGGYDVDSVTSGAFSTSNEADVLTSLGFTQFEFTDESELKPGDILLKRLSSSGHTEIYLGNGYTVGAHDGTYSITDEGYSGDQTGDEVSITPYSSSGWMYYFRDMTIV